MNILNFSPNMYFLKNNRIDLDEYNDTKKEVCSYIFPQPLLSSFYGFNIDIAFFIKHKQFNKFIMVMYANNWDIESTRELPKLNLRLIILENNRSSERIGVFQCNHTNVNSEEQKWDKLLQKYNGKVFSFDVFAKQPWDIREKVIELMYNTTTL